MWGCDTFTCPEMWECGVVFGVVDPDNLDVFVSLLQIIWKGVVSTCPDNLGLRSFHMCRKCGGVVFCGIFTCPDNKSGDLKCSLRF
jgi:hypothetical protein